MHILFVHIAQCLHWISIFFFLECLGPLSRALICLSLMYNKSPTCKYDMSFLFPAYRTVYVRCTLALSKVNCKSHNSSTEYSVRRIVFLLALNSCGKAESEVMHNTSHAKKWTTAQDLDLFSGLHWSGILPAPNSETHTKGKKVESGYWLVERSQSNSRYQWRALRLRG